MMPPSTPDMAKSRLPDAGWAWPLGYWTAIAATLLGVIAVAGFLFAGPLSAVGFVAWGFVLFLITGLPARRFRRATAR